MNNTNIHFYWAEVIDTDNTYLYNNSDSADSNNQYLYTVTVRMYDTDIQSYPVPAKPYNLNNVHVPVKGEHVIIFQAIGPRNSDIFDKTTQWYYLNPISINSNINQNSFPGIASANSADETIQRNISPVQIYKGDNVIQGRFGNIIRLGSTPTSNQNYFKSPPWIGNSNDPIIVISNSKTNRGNNEITTNNINTDYSSLYLTSTQELTGYTVTKSLKQENGYQSQLIGIADRINLNAKTDSVTINAPNNIELNTNKVVFGTSSDKEDGIHSTELLDVLNKIINVISLGFKTADNTIITTALDQTSLLQAASKLDTILNPKIQQDKRTI
jgi:hypothetical protein